MKQLPEEFYAGDLFGEIHQAETEPKKRSRAAILPGLMICATASLAATWLAEHYGFPIILLGLLIGLALSFASEDPRTHAGLDFAARHGLRLGIVVLGLQITFMQVAALGWLAFVGLALVMFAAFFSAVAASRWLGEGREAGVLAGGATAICGASAALALYGVIGQRRLDPTRFSITLVGVALASAIAMTAYPVLAQMLGLSDAQAGFLIGASVHDVAQAIGGGYSFSDAAGADATIVKLARVAMLAPIVALVAIWLGRDDADTASKPLWRKVTVPWFIVGFLVLVAVNSVVAMPEGAREHGLTLSKSLLLLAVTAAAMRSRLALLLEAGWKPLVPVFAATLASFLVALTVSMTMLD
ncbi:MAG: putative sulfate exporter family transporter [Erythrobacter sp.]